MKNNSKGEKASERAKENDAQSNKIKRKQIIIINHWYMFIGESHRQAESFKLLFNFHRLFIFTLLWITKKKAKQEEEEMKLSHKHKHHMSTQKKNPSILRKTSETIITFMSSMRAQERERASERLCVKKNIINQSSARFFRLPPLRTKNHSFPLLISFFGLCCWFPFTIWFDGNFKPIRERDVNEKETTQVCVCSSSHEERKEKKILCVRRKAEKGELFLVRR